MSAIVAMPNRVGRLFRISREPMHPQYHETLSTLRAMSNDPAVIEFHRRAIAERLRGIEALRVGAYNPGPEIA